MKNLAAPRFLFCLLPGLALAAGRPARAQSVGIGTTSPAASAALEIKSTSQGLLLPRLTLGQRDVLTASPTAPPVPGLVIYQTDNTPGLYAYDGTAWVRLGPDNLGNHTATTNVGLNNNWLSNAPGNANGLRVDNAGNVSIGSTGPPAGSSPSTLEVAGTVAAPFTNLGLTANYFDLNSGGRYYTVRLSPTANNTYIRLPIPFVCPGRIYVLLNTSAFPIALPTGPPVIDETNTAVTTLPARSRLSIQADGNPGSGTGSNWYVIGR